MIKKIIITFICLALYCCSESKKEEKNSAEISYIKANKTLKDKNYSQAADEFEKIDSDFPFSKWANKGHVMAIYARYKEGNYTKLIQSADDFMRLNPNSEYIPYILYMKGLSYYNQIPSIERSQDQTQQASYIFRELIARFPISDYSSDAREKLGSIDEHLAGAKMSIARYQAKNHNYIGAINNFKFVIERYRQTNQIPEAYFRLGEIYYKIGIKNKAKNAIDTLKIRFPDSKWALISQELDQKIDNNGLHKTRQ